MTLASRVFDGFTEVGKDIKSLTVGKASTQSVAQASPAGQVAYFAFSSAPSGWLKANGAAVSRATYSALFAAIGTTYGGGDGSTTFNLPDLRGEFIRGWCDGRPVDVGRAFGSAQTDIVKLRDVWTNYFVGPNPTSGSNYPIILGQAATANVGYQNLPNDQNAETRPRNIAMLACIKT